MKRHAYPDMSGMVENNVFPPGVSIHVSLILLKPTIVFLCSVVSREPGAKKIFCDPERFWVVVHQLQDYFFRASFP